MPEAPISSLSEPVTPLAPSVGESQDGLAQRRLTTTEQLVPRPPEAREIEENTPAKPKNEPPKSLQRQMLEAHSATELALVLIRANKEGSPDLDKIKGRVNLRNLDLRDPRLDVAAIPYDKVDLTGAVGAGVNFTGANMRHALMPNAKLAGAIFSGSETNLDRANFAGADLQGAHMDGVSAQMANFTGANMRGLKADRVDFRDTNFSGALAPDAEITNSELTNTKWNNVKGSKIDFTGSRGKNVEMNHVDMPGATLSRSMDITVSGNMNGADMSRATVNASQVGAAVIAGAKKGPENVVTDYTAAPVAQATVAAAAAKGSSVAGSYAKFGIETTPTPSPLHTH